MLGGGLWSAAIFIVAFVSGFLISKVLDKRSLNDLKMEIEELKFRLQGAENLLSEKAIQSWHEIDDFEKVSLQKTDAVLDDANRVKLRETETSAEQYADQNGEIPEIRPTAKKGRRQKVRLTKVIGKENGAELRDPILGYEDNPPVVGESYRILREDGHAFYTSIVTKVSSGYIQTLNSVYRIETVASSKTKGNEESS